MSDIDTYLIQLRSHLSDLDPKRADEIIAEARTHLESCKAKLEASGMSRGQAVADAVEAFGDLRCVAQRLRDANAGHQHIGPFRLLIAAQLGLAGSFLAIQMLNGELALPFGTAILQSPSTPWVHLLAFGVIAGPAALLGGLAAGRSWWWLPAAPVGMWGLTKSVLDLGRGEITGEACLVAAGIIAIASASAFAGARIRLRSVAGMVGVALTCAFLLYLDSFDTSSRLLASLSPFILLHLWWRWRYARVRKPVLEASHV